MGISAWVTLDTLNKAENLNCGRVGSRWNPTGKRGREAMDIFRVQYVSPNPLP